MGDPRGVYGLRVCVCVCVYVFALHLYSFPSSPADSSLAPRSHFLFNSRGPTPLLRTPAPVTFRLSSLHLSVAGSKLIIFTIVCHPLFLAKGDNTLECGALQIISLPFRITLSHQVLASFSPNTVNFFSTPASRPFATHSPALSSQDGA